jgi:uncharacterized protein (DUF58 family)
MEEAIPRMGLVMFEDAETGGVLEFDTSGPEAREYERRVGELRLAREQTLRRLKMDFVNVRTDHSYVDALVHFFRAREKRMHHV